MTRRLRVASESGDAASGATPPVRPDASPEQDTRRLVPATIDALRAAGALDHWAGRAAIVAARHIDTEHPPAAPLAALLKAHRDSMRAALDGSAAEGDALDSVFSRTS